MKVLGERGITVGEPVTRVNSWNSWDPLRHIIVGLADGTMVQAPEPAVFRDWPDDGFPRGTYGPVPEDLVAAANEQLDGFARLLTDPAFKPGCGDEYEALSFDEQIERVRANDLCLTEAEPLFDAADIGRFGKDLFVQLSLVTNRGGYRWIKQHFPNHRVHAVTFDNAHPLHIDATWVPLRPGLVLHCGERAADPELLGYFKANDWEVVSAAPPRRSRDEL